MSYDRNLKYLNNNRIIYRTTPDTPKTHKWGWYFEDGIYTCYDLFKSNAKINTYRSLKWHLYVIWYLNPDINENEFKKLTKVITYKPNGFVTFNIPDDHLDDIVKHVTVQDLDKPPKNRLRKIIFHPNSGLSIDDKLKVVGTLAGRSKKVTDNYLYDMMLFLNERKEKITIAKLAKLCNCTPRTIHRNMCEELKKEKEMLNKNYEKNIN